MIRIFKAGAAGLAAAVVSFAPLSQAAAPPPALPPGAWPQATSDLKPDPDVRFGVLPNGMRYAIRRQTIPAGLLSKTVGVTINGDGVGEINEVFTLSITSASGASIADATALGTITNDDP